MNQNRRNNTGKNIINPTSQYLRGFKIPLMTAGILIALIAIIILLWQSPWGISAGYRNWGEWILFLTGLSDTKPIAPWMNGISLSNIGILTGAFASALLSGKFALQRAPAKEYLKAAIGGIFMGAGAVLAGGCNVGGFFSAIGLFSLGGYTMMAGLGAGAYLGLKILIWDMNRKENSESENKASFSQIKAPEKFQQPVGIIIIVTLVLIFYYYSGHDKTIEGGLLFFGMLTGIIMHRSRFCFARAFRCPFMTGDSEMVKVVALSLAVYGTGAAVIKWGYIQPPLTGTHHPFWIGSLAGGVLFGTGMVIAGGCASSTLWRIGEGNIKLILTLICFALTNALLYPVIKQPAISSLLGKGICLPELLSWNTTIPVFVFILVLWVGITAWNEKTDRFVLE